MLENGAWLDNARHANECARRLVRGIADVPGISLAAPVEANGVFLNLPAPVQEGLRARGWQFYGFIGGASRFMFAWDSEPARVDALAQDIRLCALPAAA